MTDLTTITSAFGLLDAETQEALRAHGGPYQVFTYEGMWDDTLEPYWQKQVTYRVKPQPPKPREWLMSASGVSIIRVDSYTNIEQYQSLGWIHVREVL